METVNSNPITTISERRALLQAFEDNATNMKKSIKDYEADIKSLKEDLTKEKGWFESQLTASGFLDNFKQCVLTNLEELDQP